MIVGLVAFGVYSFVSHADAKERLYFEADASGRLVPVDQPTSRGKPMPELLKPEPRFLLELGSEIQLDEKQSARIREIENHWAIEKAGLERQMRAHSQFLEPTNRPRLSMASATRGLAGYSELSRAYGMKRTAAWQAAVDLLNREQLGLLKRAAKNSKVRK